MPAGVRRRVQAHTHESLLTLAYCRHWCILTGFVALSSTIVLAVVWVIVTDAVVVAVLALHQRHPNKTVATRIAATPAAIGRMTSFSSSSRLSLAQVWHHSRVCCGSLHQIIYFSFGLSGLGYFTGRRLGCFICACIGCGKPPSSVFLAKGWRFKSAMLLNVATGGVM